MKGYSRTKMLTIEHYITHLTIICNNKRIPWSCNKSLANLIPILLEGRLVLQGTRIEFEYMVLTKRIGWYFSCKHYLTDLNCIATRVKPFATFGAKYIFIQVRGYMLKKHKSSCSSLRNEDFKYVTWCSLKRVVRYGKSEVGKLMVFIRFLWRISFIFSLVNAEASGCNQKTLHITHPSWTTISGTVAFKTSEQKLALSFDYFLE